MGAGSEPYGVRACMWALGISLLEIITGKHPFSRMPILLMMVTLTTWTPTFPSNDKISTEMETLIKHLYVCLSFFNMKTSHNFCTGYNTMCNSGHEHTLKYLKFHLFEIYPRYHQVMK